MPFEFQESPGRCKSEPDSTSPEEFEEFDQSNQGQDECKSEPDSTFAKEFDPVQSSQKPILFQSERRRKHIEERVAKQIHEGDPNSCVELRGYQFDLFEF